MKSAASRFFFFRKHRSFVFVRESECFFVSFQSRDTTGVKRYVFSFLRCSRWRVYAEIEFRVFQVEPRVHAFEIRRVRFDALYTFERIRSVSHSCWFKHAPLNYDIYTDLLFAQYFHVPFLRLMARGRVHARRISSSLLSSQKNL